MLQHPQAMKDMKKGIDLHDMKVRNELDICYLSATKK